MLLDGKTVFLTGATGGIGRPLLKALEKSGATVAFHQRCDDGDIVENLDSVCLRIQEQAPDILINLAGINQFSSAEDQDYDTLVSVNLTVPMRLCQAVLPAMKARNSGHLVTVGSMAALIPMPHVTGYVAAKAGLKAFSDALRRELDGTNIAVTHIAPRAVETTMNNGPAGKVNIRTGITSDQPEQVAECILQALAHRKREVRIGGPERIFAFLNANMPFLVDRGLRKTRKTGESVLSDLKHQEP